MISLSVQTRNGTQLENVKINKLQHFLETQVARYQKTFFQPRTVFPIKISSFKFQIIILIRLYTYRDVLRALHCRAARKQPNLYFLLQTWHVPRSAARQPPGRAGPRHVRPWDGQRAPARRQGTAEGKPFSTFFDLSQKGFRLASGEMKIFAQSS